jgi:hypothetical protein
MNFKISLSFDSTPFPFWQISFRHVNVEPGPPCAKNNFFLDKKVFCLNKEELNPVILTRRAPLAEIIF